MFRVETTERVVVDAWPVAGSGLSARVVNGATAAGLTTVGALLCTPDKDLLALRSIGYRSLNEIRLFQRLADTIALGQKVFITLQEVLDLFLDKEEMGVLEGRMGLRRADMAASSDHMTLQEIGTAMQLTRERIRQVEETARAKCSSRMARLCLGPFYLYTRSFIAKRGGVATCADLADLDGQAWLTGYNPCSVLLLLHQIDPAQIAFHHAVFTTRETSLIQDVEERARQELRQAGRPLSIQELVRVLKQPDNDTAWPEEALIRLLDATPALLATTGHLYALAGEQTDQLVRCVVEDQPRPAHYRAITQAYNDAVLPSHRKGSGYILKTLNQSPLFIKTGPGSYDLAEDRI